MVTDANRTLEKGLEMLFQFSEENPVMSVKDIITQLELPRSTAYRLLDTLKNKKLIQEHGPGRYRLGLSVLHLAKVATTGMDLLNLSIPVMEILSKITNETVILSGLIDDHAICIDRIESSQPIKLTFERGRIQPLHFGASAKILMAFLDNKRQNHLLETLMKNKSIDSIKVYRQQLDDIKQRGYVISSEEIDPGVWAVATPLFGVSNQILAGITVAGPKFRIDAETEKKIVEQLMNLTQDLNEKIKLMEIDSI